MQQCQTNNWVLIFLEQSSGLLHGNLSLRIKEANSFTLISQVKPLLWVTSYISHLIFGNSYKMIEWSYMLLLSPLQFLTKKSFSNIYRKFGLCEITSIPNLPFPQIFFSGIFHNSIFLLFFFIDWYSSLLKNKQKNI